jgi:hypothetical protein
MWLGAYGGPILYQISDAQPADNSPGFSVQLGAEPKLLNTTKHVWAAALPNRSASAVVTSGDGLAVSLDVSNATRAAAYCQITVTTTAASLASLLATAGCPAIQPGATAVGIIPESSTLYALRWRADGTAPTASAGMPLFGNVYTELHGTLTINALQLISPLGSITTDINIGG